MNSTGPGPVQDYTPPHPTITVHMGPVQDRMTCMLLFIHGAGVVRILTFQIPTSPFFVLFLEF